MADRRPAAPAQRRQCLACGDVIPAAGARYPQHCDECGDELVRGIIPKGSVHFCGNHHPLSRLEDDPDAYRIAEGT